MPLLTDEDIRQIRKDMEEQKAKAEAYNKTLERIGRDRGVMAKTDQEATGIILKTTL